jgi:response regulator RpfG family c-di-GMP phosphodiesterase
MDGWQLLRMVRARPTLASTPFVLFTSLSGEAERLRGYQLGVDDYIAKPFSSDELVLRLTKVLARSRQRPRSPASNNALRGDLSQVGLQSVLSFIEMEKRSGTLLVVSGDDLVTLHCREGQVVQVDLPAAEDHREGIERLLFPLDLTEGRFDLTATDVTAKDSIGVPTSYALLEHARRRDEGEQ